MRKGSPGGSARSWTRTATASGSPPGAPDATVTPRLGPPPHPKYRGRGGLFQAPGCAPYSLAASGEGSNAMGAEEHAAVVGLHEIDATQGAVVGGKGAHLGELSHIDDVRVPPGFCVTTHAFRRIMANAPAIDDRLDRLARLNPDDREGIRALSAEIRRTVEGV